MTMRRAPFPFLLVVACSISAGAQAARPRATEVTRNGFSVARLARLDSFLDRSVDSGRIGGAVVLVTRDGRVVYERAVGWSDREASRRMTSDAIFRIASQSKAITTTAAMILVEEGRLALTDPVSRYIPAFAATTVASRADTGRTIVPAKRRITIRDLMTQTAGISYGFDASIAQRYSDAGLGKATGMGWYFADKDEPICRTIERLATLPFVAQPGEAFVYGYASDVLGCVIERASGMSLDEFVHSRITGPLAMHDTHFFLPVSKQSRLAKVYLTDSSGHTVPAPEGARGQGHYVAGPRRSFSGGAGMLSTAHDYGRFLRMLQRGGELDGVRILSPKSVEVMTSDQIGALYNVPGMGFGLGFYTVERTGAEGLASVHSFGWAGAYGTTYLVDPAEGLVVLVMIQQLPSRTETASRFPTLVYQALVDSRLRRHDRVR